MIKVFIRSWYGTIVSPSWICKVRWWLKWQLKSLYDPNYKYFKKHGSWPTDDAGRIRRL